MGPRRSRAWVLPCPSARAPRRSAAERSVCYGPPFGPSARSCPWTRIWWWWCGDLSARPGSRASLENGSGSCGSSSVRGARRGRSSRLALAGERAQTRHPRMLVRLLVLLIRAYQAAISPLLGPSCRFFPSCSHYMVACLERHGALRGGWLGLRRICRCHPFHPGGYDPPPEPRFGRAGGLAGTDAHGLLGSAAGVLKGGPSMAPVTSPPAAASPSHDG
jgi:putative membrane protein insertion efficiency factor